MGAWPGNRSPVIIACRSISFDDLEKQARTLSLKERATLARLLIEELDMSFDADAEQLWIDEA
jgi:hypothetical protein